eukprot:Hpha_TRINITY_DN16603_c3_g9::TRINITY_DN16603_c3_g9_i1::g.183071::m.183071
MAVQSERCLSEVMWQPSFHQVLWDLCPHLTVMCKRNDKLRTKADPTVSVFDGTCAADMSVTDYMIRLVEYGRASPGVFATAAVLLDRALERGVVWLDSISIHRLLLAAFVVAVKSRDDFYYRQSYYALVGGIAMEEVNRMELALLSLLDWDIQVSPEDCEAFMLRARRACLDDSSEGELSMDLTEESQSATESDSS